MHLIERIRISCEQVGRLVVGHAVGLVELVGEVAVVKRLDDARSLRVCRVHAPVHIVRILEHVGVVRLDFELLYRSERQLRGRVDVVHIVLVRMSARIEDGGIAVHYGVAVVLGSIDGRAVRVADRIAGKCVYGTE